MRRLLAMAVLALAVGAISVLGSGASDATGTSYLVDASSATRSRSSPGRT
jgi:hypothetical protein